MNSRQPLVLCLTCLAWASVCTAQANSYLGVWGRMFQGTAANASAPADGLSGRLHQVAEGWKADAEEAQSRLMQRIHSRNVNIGASWNSTQAIASLASLLSQHHGAPQAETAANLTLLQAALSGNTSALVRAAELFAGVGTASALASDAGEGSLLQRLQQHLSDGHLAHLDPAQLAALAVLQGWALSALAKQHSGTGTGSDGDGFAAAHGAIHSGGATLRSAGLPFEQLGQVTPESRWGDFEPELCARLQNFGGAQGYRAVYLGRHPCNAPGNAASDQLSWGNQAAFTADCALTGADAAAGVATAVGGEGSAAAGPTTMTGRFQAAATKAAVDFNAAIHRTMQCSLAVTSSSGAAGSGAIVHHSQGVQLLGGPKLNAIRIRLCNIAPSSIQFPAALHGSGSSLDLHGLRLNGRTLVSNALKAVQASSPEGCHSYLYRVPARSLSEGFVVNGWLELGSGHGGAWGVGEQSSVELQFGHYKLSSPLLKEAEHDAAQWQILTQNESAAAAAG